MKKQLAICIIIIILAVVGNARIINFEYDNTHYTGAAWDWGGFDVLPEPAIFICPGVYNADTHHFTPNPLALLFPDLLTDC